MYFSVLAEVVGFKVQDDRSAGSYIWFFVEECIEVRRLFVSDIFNIGICSGGVGAFYVGLPVFVHVSVGSVVVSDCYWLADGYEEVIDASVGQWAVGRRFCR